MPSTYSQIRTALGVELTELLTDSPVRIASVQYGRRTDFSGYPAVRYFFDGVTNELLAGGGAGSVYRRGYRFRVEIHQERVAKDSAESEDALGAAVDAVMDKLEANWNLGAANDILNPPAADSIRQEQSEAGNTIIIPILVTSRTIHSHSS